MNIKWKTKILVLALSIVLIFPITAFANTTSSTNYDKQTTVLNEFLDAVKSEDVTKISNLEEDTRTSTSDQSELLKENFKKTSEQLSSFEILSKKELSDKEYKIITKLTFEDGSISQVPFNIKNFGKDSWKVSVTPNSLEDKDYNQIIKPKIDNSTSAKKRTLLSSQLATWNFSDLNGTIYSKATFNVNSSSVKLNLRQWAEYTPPDTANINYAVVQYHWYGDTVWGSVNVLGNYPDSGIPRTIYGNTSSLSDAKVRFTKHYDESSNQLGNNGYGEIYSN